MRLALIPAMLASYIAFTGSASAEYFLPSSDPVQDCATRAGIKKPGGFVQLEEKGIAVLVIGKGGWSAVCHYVPGQPVTMGEVIRLPSEAEAPLSAK